MRAHTAHDSTRRPPSLTIYDSVRRYGAALVSSSNRATGGSEFTFSHVNFINNTGGMSSSALTVSLTYPGGDSIPAVMSDVSFAGNVGTGGRPVATYRGSDTVWHCRRGSWMPRSGELYGDFSAPECYPCSAGYVGSAAFLTNASCSGQCPTGHFCAEGTSTPQPCPSGTFMPARGAASGKSCIPCAPGQHQPDSGKVECLPCPAGSFSPELFH